MRMTKDLGLKVCAGMATMAILFILTSIAVNAEDKIVTQETLLDRIQIEDLLAKYYVDLTSGSSHDLAQYYTEDALLDVNGTIVRGRNEIEKFYSEPPDGDLNPPDKMHILLNNPIININGNTATAWAIWTVIINDDIKKPPRLLEQGREYDELAKIDGRWYIKKRYIATDSGLPESWLGDYKPRKFR